MEVLTILVHRCTDFKMYCPETSYNCNFTNSSNSITFCWPSCMEVSVKIGSQSLLWHNFSLLTRSSWIITKWELTSSKQLNLIRRSPKHMQHSHGGMRFIHFGQYDHIVINALNDSVTCTYIRVELILLIFIWKDVRSIVCGISGGVGCETHYSSNRVWAPCCLLKMK